MTYCVGMLLEGGLVMIADTRTNAGVDNISSYRKLHTLADDEDRLILASTSGNLSITQTALGLLEEGLPRTDEEPGNGKRLMRDMPSMFRAAQLVGDAVRIVREDMKPALDKEKVSAGISVIVGGRIGGGPLKLYHIYSAGNFIECQADQPFLQIGETKYGKPILDRALKIRDAARRGGEGGLHLVRFDDPVQPCRRSPARSRRDSRRSCSAGDPPAHRGRRCLFQRSLEPLVVDAERGARDDPRSAVHVVLVRGGAGIDAAVPFAQSLSESRPLPARREGQASTSSARTLGKRVMRIWLLGSRETRLGQTQPTSRSLAGSGSRLAAAGAGGVKRCQPTGPSRSIGWNRTLYCIRAEPSTQ